MLVQQFRGGGGVHMLGIKLFGGAKIEWSACAMGKRGTPLANMILMLKTFLSLPLVIF